MERAPSWQRQVRAHLVDDREWRERKEWAGFGGNKKGHWQFQELKEARLNPRENGEIRAR